MMNWFGALAVACSFGLGLFHQTDSKVADTTSNREKVLDTVWQRINDSFFDPKFNGVDWNAVRDTYKAKLPSLKTDEQYYELLNDMLGELKQSHMGVISPSNYLAEEEAMAKGAEAEAGLVIQVVEDKPVVTLIDPAYPAAKAGIQPGFIVNKIDTKDLSKVWQELKNRKEVFLNKTFLFGRITSRYCHGKPNQSVRFDCINSKGQPQSFTVKLQKVKGQPIKFGELPTMSGYVEAKMLPNQIAYIRLSIFMMPLLNQVTTAIKSFKKAKGLVFDLRQNPGGLGAMAIPISGHLVTRSTSLGAMHMRSGETRLLVNPREGAYSGPVAILTDEGSASTSEIMAGGLQEAGCAVVVGQTTTGAVLPSMVEKMIDGSRLQYPIADFRTPKGVLLEGKGVVPDYPVKLTRQELLTKKDPVLVKAIAVLKKMATQKGRKP